MNSIWDFLPMPFWLGPPLPKAFGVYWPFAQSGQAPSLPSLPSFISNVTENLPGPSTTTTTTYDNTETVEFPEGFDPDTFMPRKIVIHRNAKVSK